MSSVAPVMCRTNPEARNTTVAATSSGGAASPSGNSWDNSARFSCGQERLCENNTQLYGDAPFLQLPPGLTAELPDTPIAALHLTQASGRDVTLLSRHFDAVPIPLSPEHAARTLVTFQAFAPSRGLTRWHPSKDTPHARSVHFHATGAHLTATLDLNTTPGLDQGTPPSWEIPPDWNRWRQAERELLTPGNLHAHPWRSVTLRPEQDGTVRWAAQASGIVPTPPTKLPWPDPHAFGEQIEQQHQETRGHHDRQRNPPSREVMGTLVGALAAALHGHPLAPMSFMNAWNRGAERLWAVGLITRSGQPVALHVAEASLPWPTLGTPKTLEALDAAMRGLNATLTAVAAALKGRSTLKDVHEGAWPGFYWNSVWPALSERLTDSLSAAAFEDAAEAAALATALGTGNQHAALIRHLIAQRNAA